MKTRIKVKEQKPTIIEYILGYTTMVALYWLFAETMYQYWFIGG